MENEPLKIGDPAPDFDLMDETKKKIQLSSLRGKKVVLLFYPMDFSPTCTTENCAFGADLPKLASDGKTVVLGVSCDSPFCHAAFKEKYNIPYSLLADTTRKMAKAYGMWAGEEPYNCTKRGTVIVNATGLIAHWEEVPMREARDVNKLAELVAKV